MAANNGRDGGGRFAKGDKLARGRPREALNQSTVDIRRIRADVAASWERVDGCSKLLHLAEDDFPTYLRIVATVMPKSFFEP